jgi:hypothetical protein
MRVAEKKMKGVSDCLSPALAVNVSLRNRRLEKPGAFLFFTEYKQDHRRKLFRAGIIEGGLTLS